MNLQSNQDKKNLYFLIWAVVLILLDQISKVIIKDYFIADYKAYGFVKPIHIIDGFLQITYVENEGMAGGISFGPGKIILSLFSVIASIALLFYLKRIKNYSNWIKTGVMFILAGAVGNLIDRVFYGVIYNESALFYGRVVDFIYAYITDIDIFGFKYRLWPVFNVADACVTVGVAFLLIFHKKLPSFNEVFPKKKANEQAEEITNSIF